MCGSVEFTNKNEHFEINVELYIWGKMLNVPLKCPYQVPSFEEYWPRRDNGDKLFALIWVNGSSGFYFYFGLKNAYLLTWTPLFYPNMSIGDHALRVVCFN